VADRPTSGPAIVVGSGGIMAALARNRTRRRPITPQATGSSGPTLVVSASASATTAAQIDDAVGHGWVNVAIPNEAFDEVPQTGWEDAIAHALARGHNVVAHTARGPGDPRLGSNANAEQVGTMIGAVAARMTRSGLTRDVIICGGDTSSHALAAMNISELRVSELFVTAGPICSADPASDAADCRLLLKGGQVGGPALFRTFAGEIKER
jgi:uncharacterized protein YgbK (DUF1537 family)